MKVQRYDAYVKKIFKAPTDIGYGMHYEFCDACKSEDVAELEVKCAELEALNAEMLDIIKSLHHCSEYWSDFDVPVGIVDRVKKVITQAKGDNYDQL